MAYSYKRKISIDESKCGVADSTDFPLMFAGTYAWLATTANGGGVENANGYDVAFFADAALTTQLKHEVELYTAATGAVIYHVKIPTLSTSANTDIYIAYGDSGISTSQADPTNVWDSYTKVVYHVPDGTNLSLADSSANNYALTNNADQVTAAAGKIGGAASFPDTTSQALNSAAANTRVTVNGGVATISMWAYITNPSASAKIANLTRNTYTGNAFWIIDWNKDYNADANRKIRFTAIKANAQTMLASTTKFTFDTWTHFVFTYDGTNVKIYQNGVETDSAAFSSSTAWPASAASGALVLGQGSNTTTNAFKGRLDEFKVAGIDRSASWILAEYNNQNSPATFYVVIPVYVGSIAATISAVTCEATGTHEEPGGESYTGTIDATLGAVTCAASGTMTVTGTCAATVEAVTCAAAGSLAASGTITATLGAVTSAASGSLAFSGTAAATLGAVTASGVGNLTFAGSVAATIGLVVAAATGSLAFVGTLDATLGAVLCAASGTHGSASYEGSCAATVGPVACAASGSLSFVGTLAATIGPVVMWSFQAELATYIGTVHADQRSLSVDAEPRRLFVQLEQRELGVDADARQLFVQQETRSLPV